MKPTDDAYTQMQEAFDYYNEQLFDGKTKPCLVTFFRNKRSQGYFSKERFASVDGTRVDEIALNVSLFATYPLDDVMGTLVHEMAHSLIEHSENSSRKGYHNKAWGDLMESVGLMPSSTGLAGGAKLGQKMSHYSMPGGRFEVVSAPLIDRMKYLKWFDRYVPVRPESIKVFMGKVTDAGGSKLMTEIPAFEFSSQLGLVLPGGTARKLKKDEYSEDDEEDGYQPVDLVLDGDNKQEKKNKTKSQSGGASGGHSEERESEIKINSSNRIKYSCKSCGMNVWGKPRLKIGCLDCDEILQPE